MFDKHEPFLISEKALTFIFEPKRYEIWAGGVLIKEGNINGRIECSPLSFEVACCKFETFNLPSELNLTDALIFDITFTGKDRIYMATVPEVTNIGNYNSFVAFKQMIPLNFPIITRYIKEFEEDEPYVCSIYTIDNKYVKLAFSFGNNPRLLELYA
jgi:hypothetical protein